MTEDTSSDSLSFFRSGIREPIVPTPGLEPGKIVGDFELLTQLGQGGMGQVWEANQLSLSRQVAVKFVRPERVTKHQLELFAREARAGGRLSHTGIVAVYGHGESDGLAWIAMELVPGAWDLRDFLDEVTRMGEVPDGYDKKVAQFIAKVADAVQAAHDAGVIHRDLKPQNILITESDDPKVTDFGLARIVDEQALSHTGDFAGTYFYMSPEQVAAKRAGLDHRTDVFSLGIVLYEMLSLARPFQGDTEHQVADQILMKDPVNPRTLRSKVPGALAVICMKALEKDRDKRFDSMASIAADLRRWLGKEPIRATPPTRFDQLVKWCQRNPTKSIVGAVVVVALLGISTLLVANLRVNRNLNNQKLLAENRADELYQQRLALSAAKDTLEVVGQLATKRADDLARSVEELGVERTKLYDLNQELNVKTEEALENARKAIENEERAEKEAEESRKWLNDVARLTSMQNAQKLVSEAGELWPATLSNVDAYKDWMERAEALVSELPAHREVLSKIESNLASRWLEAGPISAQRRYAKTVRTINKLQSTPNVSDDERERLTDTLQGFSRLDRNEWLAAQLAELIEVIEGIEANLVKFEGGATGHGWSIAKRLSFARSIMERSVDGKVASLRWSEAIAAIASSELYDELDLSPQAGLIPIGTDPHSGLWEFAHLATGTPPSRQWH